jgi:hypothetical protein
MDRKTLDQRAPMTDLERLRHSAAHVMATAILRFWPDAQFAYGPPVDDGFYYDVDLKQRISPEDFPKIEAEMKAVVKANQVFERVTVTRDQALADAQSGRLAALGARDVPEVIVVQGGQAVRQALLVASQLRTRSRQYDMQVVLHFLGLWGTIIEQRNMQELRAAKAR